MSRFLPDRLATRFALLLAGALIAANVAALVLLSFERDRLGREARADREIERIVGLVPALEAVDAPTRRIIAREASTRIARIGTGPRPLVSETLTDARSRALAARLSEALGPRTVRVGVPARAGDRHRDPFAISIRLDTDDPRAWLNVRTRSTGRGRRAGGGRVPLLFLGLSMVSVLGVGLVFLHRLTRPLGQLADAARAAGGGDRTARVPEEGAREMREAAAAFNDMQTRIAGFEAERMRTLAAVGHDLRTPITSLRIRAEMLDDETREPMIRTLDEMTVMAGELIAYARDRDEAEATRAVDLSDLLTHLCKERGASLTVMEAATVTARPVALGRAIGNLIDNALRYGGRAEVTLKGRPGGIVVTVEDDGPGIDPDRLSDMMEPFVRGEASRSADTGGAGLGLSIARRILLAHGGTLDLANRPEGGLRATVTLPVMPSPA